MRMRASWFGSLRPTGYKVAARVPRARQRAPLGCVIPTTTSVPRCSGLSRCGLETTERAATAERRPTLTAPARAGLHHVRVGAKKRDSKSNKETGMKEVENGSNKRLTSTASYKDKPSGRPPSGAVLDRRCARRPHDRADRDGRMAPPGAEQKNGIKQESKMPSDQIP
jgi:hypothetical protein